MPYGSLLHASAAKRMIYIDRRRWALLHVVVLLQHVLLFVNPSFPGTTKY